MIRSIGKQIWSLLDLYWAVILVTEIILIFGMLAELFLGCNFFQRSGAVLIIYAVVLSAFKDLIHQYFSSLSGAVNAIHSNIKEEKKKHDQNLLKVNSILKSGELSDKKAKALNEIRNNLKTMKKGYARLSLSNEELASLKMPDQTSFGLIAAGAAIAVLGTMIWGFGDLLTPKRFCYFGHRL